MLHRAQTCMVIIQECFRLVALYGKNKVQRVYMQGTVFHVILFYSWLHNSQYQVEKQFIHDHMSVYMIAVLCVSHVVTVPSTLGFNYEQKKIRWRIRSLTSILCALCTEYHLC